jgi:GntR family transcriptional regulator
MKFFDESKPIYLQIMDEIKRSISRGELKEGDKVPSVREFAQKLGVNPNTVARAYMELEREGILVTKRGQGTFVSDDREMIRSIREDLIRKSFDTFLSELKELGISKEEIRKILKKLEERF